MDWEKLISETWRRGRWAVGVVGVVGEDGFRQIACQGTRLLFGTISLITGGRVDWWSGWLPWRDGVVYRNEWAIGRIEGVGVAFWYRGPGYIAASFGLAQSPGPVANLAPMEPFSTFSDSWRCHADARQFFFFFFFFFSFFYLGFVIFWLPNRFSSGFKWPLSMNNGLRFELLNIDCVAIIIIGGG